MLCSFILKAPFKNIPIKFSKREITVLPSTAKRTLIPLLNFFYKKKGKGAKGSQLQSEHVFVFINQFNSKTTETDFLIVYIAFSFFFFTAGSTNVRRGKSLLAKGHLATFCFYTQIRLYYFNILTTNNRLSLIESIHSTKWLTTI